MIHSAAAVCTYACTNLHTTLFFQAVEDYCVWSWYCVVRPGAPLMSFLEELLNKYVQLQSAGATLSLERLCISVLSLPGCTPLCFATQGEIWLLPRIVLPQCCMWALPWNSLPYNRRHKLIFLLCLYFAINWRPFCLILVCMVRSLASLMSSLAKMLYKWTLAIITYNYNCLPWQ